jgi:phosphatidylglycerol:prolipoprotein diacylglycerol transferase
MNEGAQMNLATVTYPQIDPFLFRIGPIGLSWYAFMYVVGFTAAHFIIRHRYRQGVLKLRESHDVKVLIADCVYGVVLGARIGYILFYNSRFYWEHPWEIPAVWHGGMSFHGGLMGCLIAVYLFSRRRGVPFFQVGDSLALCAPIGLGFGRIGNFINGELYGRVTQVPWAMVFPRGGPYPRHPSQLYESFLEGIILWTLLFAIDRRKPREGTVSAFLLIFYGIFRFVVEFFREPDVQLGTVLGPFSMGQVLSFMMIVTGLLILLWVRRTGKNRNSQEI